MIRMIFVAAMVLGVIGTGRASDLKVGDPAPVFSLKTDDGKNFDLTSRKGQWTVLYFYPKAETPGCTKQACAFRDGIAQIRGQGAELFGLSADGVEALKKFKENHSLNFTLLADPELTAINLYGTKMPLAGLSKRWTFIIGPDLKIRSIERDVDPVLDAQRVTDTLKELKKQS
jgi:thioredoxin-dependent peroxiredoxin